MDPFMMFAAGVTLLGIVGDIEMYKESKSRAAQVEQIARDNAKLARMEAQEQERRLREEQKQIEGLTKARMAASGYSENKSATEYFTYLLGEHKKEIDWITTATDMKINISLQEAAMEADAIRSQGKAALWSGAQKFATAAFYANEAGLFSTQADLLRDAQTLTNQPYWQAPGSSRYAINNPWAPSPNYLGTIK